MDPTTLLAMLPADKLIYVMAICGIAAALDAWLPPTTPDSQWAPARHLLSLIGQNYRSATNASPVRDAQSQPIATPATLPPAALLALVLAGGALAGCAASQRSQALQDAQMAEAVAHAALVAYASQPKVDPALLGRLRLADDAAASAIAAALAAPADNAKAQTAAAAAGAMTAMAVELR
jgi:hypothetical protein